MASPLRLRPYINHMAACNASHDFNTASDKQPQLRKRSDWMSMHKGCSKYYCMVTMKNMPAALAIEECNRECNSDIAEKASNHPGDLCIKVYGCATQLT